MNQYQTLKIHTHANDSFKVQNTMIDFHVTGYEKAVDVVYDPICQLTFKHYLLLTFGVVSEEKPHLS